MRARARVGCFVAIAATVLITGTAAARSVGVWPADGRSGIARKFQIDLGCEIVGVRFATNDRNTVFPEVSLIADVGVGLGTAPRLARARDVRAQETGPSFVEVMFSSPVEGPPSEVYAVIVFPVGSARVGDGAGAGIGAVTAGAGTSFVFGGDDGDLTAVDIDVDVQLLTRVNGRASKAGTVTQQDSPRTAYLEAPSQPGGRLVTIRFGIPLRARVRLAVFDVAGRLVERLTDDELAPGEYSKEWGGPGVRAGIYMLRLSVGPTVLARKIVVVRK